MKRFTQHALYKKLAICLAYALLYIVPMYTTHALTLPPLCLRNETLNLLNEYKKYSNWTKPSNGKPLLHHLYDEDQETLTRLFKNILGYAQYPDSSTNKEKSIVLNAVSSSINTPYNGESLLIRSIKDKNYNIFKAICPLHTTIFIASKYSLVIHSILSISIYPIKTQQAKV